MSVGFGDHDLRNIINVKKKFFSEGFSAQASLYIGVYEHPENEKIHLRLNIFPIRYPYIIKGISSEKCA